MGATILINGMNATASPLASQTPDACTSHNPILAAKMLLVSTAIFAGAALLIYSIYSLIIYIRRRYYGPQYHYYVEFNRAMLDMKALIELGNRTENIYPEMFNGFDTKSHILFYFRHIDKANKIGQLPPREDLEGGGIWHPILVDVIEREFEKQEFVVVPSSLRGHRSNMTGTVRI
jgi:hypothetical protein